MDDSKTPKIIDPGPNTARYPIGWYDAAVQRAWDEGKAAEDALHATDNARAGYLNTTFANWFVNYDAGRRDTPPPTPPNGFRAYVYERTEPNSAISVTWDLVQDGPAVCDVPAYLHIPEAQKPRPVAPPSPELGEVTDAEAPERDGIPVGKKLTVGAMSIVKRVRNTPFGPAYLWERVAMLLVLIALGVRGAAADVTVACSPEPASVTGPLHVREMAPWACYLRNDGTTARTVTAEDVLIAVIAIRPIDPGSAVLVLGDRQSRSAASRVIKVLTIAGQLGGVGLSLASRSNAAVGTAMSVGSAFVPAVLDIAKGEVPSTAAWTAAMLRDPVTLGPGGSATRLVFAAKQRNAGPIVVAVK